MTMSPKGPVFAAQYVRMSTDLQKYSIENQKATIQQYAEQHDFIVVKTYTDAGKGGIVLKHRTGLSTLLKDVLNGNTGFRVILVYDISRWGRFQDADEAAHYEFLCTNAGIQVHYCAEQFGNSGTVPAALLKAVKRTMAAEYSRELGVKILAGQKRLAQLGFRMGAKPGYGLRRMLISSDRIRKQKLNSGEYKDLTTDRILLVPGPKNEVECVQAIYKMALRKGMSISKIARHLNRAGIAYVNGRPWTHSAVGRTLRNPKYTGCNTWNQSSRKLHTKQVRLPPEQWIVQSGAFDAIIDQDRFDEVQDALRKRAERISDAQLLDDLRELLRAKGKLTQNLVKGAPNLHTLSLYYARFGPFRRIYELLGYEPAPGAFDRSDSRKGTRKLRAQLLARIAAMFPEKVTFVRLPRKMRFLVRLDGILDVSIVVCPSYETKRWGLRWTLNPEPCERDHTTLLCLLGSGNTDFHSFWLLHRVDKLKTYCIQENDPWLAKGQRLDELAQFYETAKALSLI